MSGSIANYWRCAFVRLRWHERRTKNTASGTVETPRCCATANLFRCSYLRFFATCVRAEPAADLAAAEECGFLSTFEALLAAFGPVVSLRTGFFVVMIDFPLWLINWWSAGPKQLAALHP